MKKSCSLISEYFCEIHNISQTIKTNFRMNFLSCCIEMHATHLSRYERNVTAPSIEVLKKISEALGVTTDMLIYGSDDDKVKDKINDNELLNMFNKVQNRDKQELSCVKSLLEAFIFKRELQHQLAK